MSNELIAQRQVTLFYTQNNERKVLQTAARTWGELSNTLGEDFSKSKVVLQESRLTLENTEAELPREPFTLFVFPRQSKAGVSNKDRDWSKMKYNKLRSVASKLNKTKNAGIPMGGSKDSIAKGVSKFYRGGLKAVHTKDVVKVKTNVKVELEKIIKTKKPSKTVVKKVINVVESIADDLDTKIEKKKSESIVEKGISTTQFNTIVGKLDSILNSIKKALPSMNEKELNSLSQLASSVKGTMQTMR